VAFGLSLSPIHVSNQTIMACSFICLKYHFAIIPALEWLQFHQNIITRCMSLHCTHVSITYRSLNLSIDRHGFWTLSMLLTNLIWSFNLRPHDPHHLISYVTWTWKHKPRALHSSSRLTFYIVPTLCHSFNVFTTLSSKNVSIMPVLITHSTII
jgi:hypothetical protein